MSVDRQDLANLRELPVDRKCEECGRDSVIEVDAATGDYVNIEMADGMANLPAKVTFLECRECGWRSDSS